jgi:hypothetical protein
LQLFQHDGHHTVMTLENTSLAISDAIAHADDGFPGNQEGEKENRNKD